MKRAYDFVITGAGPAGLSAAIVAARRGLNAVVIEKGKTAGPRPRGEGVNRYPLLDSLLGDDYFETKCFKMDGSAVYHSPGNKQQVTLPGKKPLYFFEWRDFIERLVDTAEKLAVTFLYQTEVVRPVEENGRCVGVEYKDQHGQFGKIFGNSILACDGHKSALGTHYGIHYEDLSCAMIKCLLGNANIDIDKTPELQFYLIGNGDLAYEPRFPQCVAYGFPTGGRKMEVGLMLRMSQSAKMKRTLDRPDSKTFFQVWENLKRSWPGFSDYFTGATIEHEEITGLSNAGMVRNVVPEKGLVLIGDSAGFIDPFGSSGLYSAMAMAEFWVTMISDKWQDLSGVRAGEQHVEALWAPATVVSYKKQFKKTRIYKKIKGSYSLIGKFEWFIFKFLRTGRRINKRWKLISWLLKTA